MKLSEGIGELAPDDFLAFDLQPLKEALVEQPPFLRPGLDVGRLNVVRHGERQVERFEDLAVLDAQAVNPLFGGDPLAPDPLLLVGKQALAHSVGVVGLQQLPFLLFQPREPQFGLGKSLSRKHRGGLNVLGDGLAQALPVLVAQFHLIGAVVSHDSGLDRLDAVAALLALAVLPTAANEVFVLAALAVGAAVDQATPALAAVDGAAQVVEVPPGPFAADPLARQQVLDFLKRRLVNQRLVAAGVGLAVVGDDADVIGIAQDEMQVLGLECPRRVLSSRTGAQAPILHERRQLGKRVVAGGVEREGFAHQRRALGIENYGADFAAIDHQTVVEVAERRAVGSAAGLGLLRRALHDLSCQVAAVELGDGGHDAVQQQARWRLVDVLGDGDELRACLADRHHYFHVIGAAAGQPVNLVDDHEVNATAPQIVQHFLERRTAGGPGRLSPVDVLLDDLSAELVGLALAGFALAGDGEALGVEVLVGLLGG